MGPSIGNRSLCEFFKGSKFASRLPDGSGSVALEVNPDDLYFSSAKLPFDPNA